MSAARSWERSRRTARKLGWSTLTRARVVQRTLETYRRTIRRVVADGAWVDRRSGEVQGELSSSDLLNLQRWDAGMGDCGRWGVVRSCPEGHGGQAVTTCCGKAPCPRHQRRQAQEAQAKAAKVLELFKGSSSHDWVLVTLNTRPSGDPRADVEELIRIRTKFFRTFSNDRAERIGGRQRFSGTVFGGWGKVEDSGENDAGNVHLHAFVYVGPQRQGKHRINRAEVQRWLRQMTCKVEGCSHPIADDRCLPCQRANRRGCEGACGPRHPAYRGKPRCGGSFMVDVRAARCGPCARVAAGLRARGVRSVPPCRHVERLKEAHKYAAKPMPDAASNATEAEREDHAARVLRFLLALRGRRRSQPYGIAREVNKTDDAERQGDDHEPEHAPESCARCGRALVTVAGWHWAGGHLSHVPPALALARMRSFMPVARQAAQLARR